MVDKHCRSAGCELFRCSACGIVIDNRRGLRMPINYELDYFLWRVAE